MNYLKLKQQQRKEINELPIAWAFNKQQYKEALEKLGTKDTTKLCKVPGGGIMLKTDLDTTMKTLLRHENELDEAMKNDNFAEEAFRYELENHENNVTATVRSLGLDDSMSDRLKSILYEQCRRKCGESL